MSLSNLKRNKPATHYLVISTVLILFLWPGWLSAQDPGSIDTLRQMGKAFAKIAEKTSPAVVSLRAERTITREYTIRQWDPFEFFDDDLFDRFFYRWRSPRERPYQRKYQQMAQGSGFIISPDGYILTNNHLVGDAEKVQVELADGREFTAEIKGTDPESDVALIKIDASELPHLELADSDKLEVGEWVLAIGNPFGLSHTVTAGIVSAKGRSDIGLTTYEDFIQTDAAINFGNSGGPLINLDGKVVGINTAILGSTGSIGIGFAIPINMAKAIIPQLKKGGAVERGFLGILPQDLTAAMAEHFGLKGTKGVLIAEVTEDSAADKAGLLHNDIILELDGKAVESADSFRKRIAMKRPGTTVKIVVWRDGKRKTITAKLEKRPPLPELVGAQPRVMEQLGFSVQNLTQDLAERYGYEGLSGVIVSDVEPGSQAERAGITPGTLIKEVNRTEVKNTKEFNEAVEKSKDKGSVLLLVRRQRYTFYVLLTL